MSAKSQHSFRQRAKSALAYRTAVPSQIARMEDAFTEQSQLDRPSWWPQEPSWWLRTFGDHQEASNKPRALLSEPSSTKAYPVHVFMMSRGTRGDVQPYVALARGMASLRGWLITLCTEESWRGCGPLVPLHEPPHRHEPPHCH